MNRSERCNRGVMTGCALFPSLCSWFNSAIHNLQSSYFKVGSVRMHFPVIILKSSPALSGIYPGMFEITPSIMGITRPLFLALPYFFDIARLRKSKKLWYSCRRKSKKNLGVTSGLFYLYEGVRTESTDRVIQERNEKGTEKN